MKLANLFLFLLVLAVARNFAIEMYPAWSREVGLAPIVTQGTVVQWDYVAVMFNRDEESKFDEALKKLGDNGWEFAGPLFQWSNAHVVAFRRPKMGKQ